MATTLTQAESEARERKAASALIAKALKAKTVYGLADLLGVSDTSIIRWATGTNWPGISEARRITPILEGIVAQGK